MAETKETKYNPGTGKYEEQKEPFKVRLQKHWYNFVHKAKNIWKDNKKEILFLIPSLIAGAKLVSHMADKAEEKREEQERERRVYDPSLGDWWYLKRPLTNNERLDLESRVNYGESRGQALKDMGVLRRR